MELNSITPTNPKFCWVMGVGARNPPTLMDIMLSDGSVWSELIHGIEFNHPLRIQSSGVMGVGALNSPTLMDIMLSNEGGCSESPNPHVYHVEWWEWSIWAHTWKWIQSPPTNPEVLLSDGGGWSELIHGIGFNHLLQTWTSLIDGSGCSELPNPNGDHVK